ncbi:hypothetical protein [Mycobacterium sp. PSTR-4-N]|uniref:hypothetical protein n=1 Tax=Mycobacterium sp. PSTR-4-N TaxID=2917745 RepID=UPI001F14D41A|nr:hypothetical protein [Mycobacterium sp. PSTR-4-N]MCG7596814.1 hypothetical protein [Mycobacterium sp. PSTR-4-N]
MHSSIGKPLVTFVSAACLAAPAMIPTTTPDSVRAIATIPVELSAAVTTFDPVPPSLRTLNSPVAPANEATLVGAVDTMAELSGVDRATLLLQLLTAPYHNVLGVSKAVGSAVNAYLQVASLPFSVATYVLTNRAGEIPDYIATVRKNVDGALPGISTAIKSEMQYDLDLLSQVFSPKDQLPNVAASATTVAAAADPVDQGTLLLQLLTIPYHNFLGVSKAVGSAANAVVQLVSLPLSVVTYVLTNRTSEIPAYVDTVKANLKGALPGISTAVKSELAYNKSIIDQIFGGNDAQVALQARHAPNLLAGDDTAVTVLDSPHPFLSQLSAGHGVADESVESDTAETPKVLGGKHRAVEVKESSEPTVDEAASTSDTKADNASDTDSTDQTTSETKKAETHSPADGKTATKDDSKKKKAAPSLGGKHRKPEADAA